MEPTTTSESSNCPIDDEERITEVTGTTPTSIMSPEFSDILCQVFSWIHAARDQAALRSASKHTFDIYNRAVYLELPLGIIAGRSGWLLDLNKAEEVFFPVDFQALRNYGEGEQEDDDQEEDDDSIAAASVAPKALPLRPLGGVIIDLERILDCGYRETLIEKTISTVRRAAFRRTGAPPLAAPPGETKEVKRRENISKIKKYVATVLYAQRIVNGLPFCFTDSPPGLMDSVRAVEMNDSSFDIWLRESEAVASMNRRELYDAAVMAANAGASTEKTEWEKRHRPDRIDNKLFRFIEKVMHDHQFLYLDPTDKTVVPDGFLSDFSFTGAKRVMIRGQGENSSIRKIGSNFVAGQFSGLLEIRLCNMPLHLTEIGECAFSALHSAKKLSFKEATRYCHLSKDTGLPDLGLPNLTRIGSYFLAGCPELREVSFCGLESVRRIGGGFLLGTPINPRSIGTLTSSLVSLEELECGSLGSLGHSCGKHFSLKGMKSLKRLYLFGLVAKLSCPEGSPKKVSPVRSIDLHKDLAEGGRLSSIVQDSRSPNEPEKIKTSFPVNFIEKHWWLQRKSFFLKEDSGLPNWYRESEERVGGGPKNMREMAWDTALELKVAGLAHVPPREIAAVLFAIRRYLRPSLIIREQNGLSVECQEALKIGSEGSLETVLSYLKVDSMGDLEAIVFPRCPRD